jgi:dTDP-4-dehydrorhamnose reductase
MRILVTGREGQVARSLAERAHGRPDLELVFAQRPDFDLEDDRSIERTVNDVAPDLVISAAAYTAVDKAEEEPERAERINARAPAVLARATAHAAIPLIHLSTDYVFDGKADRPYTEDMPTAPLGVYGRTKLAGEEAVRTENPDHLIVRTSWVYSPFGRNFVKTMLQLAGSRDRLTVVEDQLGNPTSALDIGDGLLTVAESWRGGASTGRGEIVHLAGTGSTNWADLARYILEVSGSMGGPVATVEGIPTSAWPTAATRPTNSRLDTARLAELFGFVAPHWQRSVGLVVERLLSKT